MRSIHGVVSMFLFLYFLVWSCFETFHCQAQPLPQHEVDALKKIGSQLGKQWDFAVDPCSGSSGWINSTSNKDFTSNVTCGACTAASCHVISIILKSQNLTGSLPDDFSALTSLQTIDLSRNYLSGTIPVAWASLPLTKLALLGNRISGSIPEEIGDISTLQELILEDNLIEGAIPRSLGKLVNLEGLLISGNYFSGELPDSLGNLRNLTNLRIDGNPISGKIPSFVGNWTKLQRLDMQGTSMEGPFPPTFSTLESLTELRVTDLVGGDGTFPPLQNMIEMKELVLRNLSISGELPEYIGNMANLKVLDLSFNNLTGQIPVNFSMLKNLKFMYLTANQLTGAIPEWIQGRKKHNIDLSYNSFDGSDAPAYCPSSSNLNLVSSYSSTFTDNKSIASCLRKSQPCSGKARNYNLFINCGGGPVTVGDDEYQADVDTEGPSIYSSFDEKWAYSSTGDFVGNEDQQYIVTNVSALNSNLQNPELYMSARLNPLSLKYYGLCLQNGIYTVNLHFAEIMFTDDQSFASLGRRYFDVSIQGEKVLRDFNIANEANGTSQAIIKSFNANVSNNTLEIHFQWAGKGTTAIPYRSVYGPLISAISVTPNFKPDTSDSRLSTGALLCWSLKRTPLKFIIAILFNILTFI
ncbi:Non-specific serine/threonine protein kinase protein [Dioscorea alata]|uniref:Non-specific serine/threonine protein kinase protein n=1 Tax=Dioscorea alata TaxID=55571 RepID=A0ACB7TUG5_DIOAL|nr:Non-specific serine/threonine protein kinase protein [Dioscorea alata]